MTFPHDWIDDADLMRQLEEHHQKMALERARVPRTDAALLVFLDIDGVLRRSQAVLWQLEPDLLGRFDATLGRLPKADVVISSGWREVFTLEDIRSHFPEDLRRRIIGGTPVTSPQHRANTLNDRHDEVLDFLKLPGMAGRAWVALDDDAHHYRPQPNIRILDGDAGFDSAAAEWLLDLGRRYGAG